MTENRSFKNIVRARAAKTGESYTAALRHLRTREPETSGAVPERTVRLAVAQTSANETPGEIEAMRACGAQMRDLMRQAREAGARLIHFPEGTLCSPGKRHLSVEGPAVIGPADWKRFAWETLASEIAEICALARALGLWVAFGSAHPLTPPRRPHSSFYVVSDGGLLVTRYDERLLSKTKISFMYTPGSEPVTFAVDGLSFGCALGMEVHYAEIFGEYERLGVDCVLFSTTVATAAMATETLGHAAVNSFWVSLSAHACKEADGVAGIAYPEGHWAARCAPGGVPSIAVFEVNNNPQSAARPWRRAARGGLYAPHLANDDPRSTSRCSF